jgi:hypothetical protein
MQHPSNPKNFSSNKTIATLTKSFLVGFVGVVTLSSVSGSVAQAATAPKPGNAAAAFCRQVTASQGSIAKAAGTPTVKLTAIGAEWTKIAATAPADIKADVMVVRTAYLAAAKAGVDTPAKAPTVATAGAKISSYFAQNCGGGGIAGAGGQGGDQGPDGQGGPGRGGFGGNSPERVAYRDCLSKNGVTLPAPGQRPNDGPGNVAGGTGPGNGVGAKPASATGVGTKGGAAAGSPAVGAKPVGGAKPAASGAGNPAGNPASNPGGPGNGGGRRGGGFGLDPSDPAVAKAMKACESLLPAGGFGGGRGGFGNPAMQACLTKKGITLTPPGGRAGGNAGGVGVGAKPAAGNAAGKPTSGAAGDASGGAAGGRPPLDAKTQAALDACQKEVGTNG